LIVARTKTETVDASILITDAETPGLPAMVAAANQEAIAHQQHEATVRAIAQQIRYQLPADCIDADLIQRDVAANMRRSVEACLEVGRGLSVLKAACGHGNFIARLDVLGIDRKVAAKFMQSAVKFSNVSSNATFEKALGNQSKLFEMLVLDDEQIEELELTGQTGELKLDEIATMSVKELRAKLREEREKAAATERVMEAKNKIIDRANHEVEVMKRRIETESADETTGELIKAASLVGFRAQHEVRANLKKAIAAIAEQTGGRFHDHVQFVTGLLADIELACIEIRDEFPLINARPDSDPTPEWLRPDYAEKLAAAAADNYGAGNPEVANG
jgi:hypothetical protein